MARAVHIPVFTFYAYILFACGLFVSYGVHATGGGEKFLNVKQWKGHLDISIKETFHSRRSWEAGHEERNLNSRRTFRIALRTGNGMATPVDPFVAQKEPKPAPVEKGDKFEGMDFDKMQRAMKRSGIDPAMMGTVMKEMNKMKGLHISAGKYKQWAETSFTSNTAGNWVLTDITRGEGMDTSGKRCSYSNRRKVDGVFDGTGGMTLFVNLQKKAYSFKWELTKKKPQKASEHVAQDDSCEGNHRKSRKINYDILTDKEARLVLFEPLPGSGMMLSGSKVVQTKRDDGTEVMTTLQWAFAPADTEIPEAWVEYDTGGEDWLPEDDNTVEAVLRWKANVSPSRVRFTLYEVSAEPGVNLNSKDKNTDPDIEFDEDNKARGFELRQSGEIQVAVKEGLSGKSEGIILRAKDFGAYGKLKAEIEVDGHWFEATARPFELPYLPVPYDKNNNFIADKWEKDVGIFGKNLDPNWDEDPYPQGQKSNNGDGFTLYEEYRGFREIGHVFKKADNEKAKDGHVRMDPMYKDIFVYDRDGLFVKYYKPYNPADLNWHLIDLTMMKTTGALETDADFRWVNFNTTKEHFFRNQYAVFVINKGVSSNTELKNDVGYTPRIPGCTKSMRYTHPLKCLYSVEIYTDTIKSWASKAPGTEAEKNKYADDQLTTTVIHELGHAVGIRHHSPREDQGVKQCAVRYDSNTEMGHPRIFGFLRTRYCGKGEIYLTGEADASGKFEQFPSHNCYGQINIKGD